MSHLSTLRKINRELQIFEKVKTETPKNIKISAKTIKGNLIPYLQKEKPKEKPKKRPKKEYFVTGTVNITTEYTKKQSKYGNKKYYDTVPVAKKIIATSQYEAEQIFDRDYMEGNIEETGVESYLTRTVTSTSVENVQVKNFDGVQAMDEADVFMKSSETVEYEFIPSEDRLNKNTGFCVPDVFIGFYSKYITSLNI